MAKNPKTVTLVLSKGRPAKSRKHICEGCVLRDKRGEACGIIGICDDKAHPMYCGKAKIWKLATTPEGGQP